MARLLRRRMLTALMQAPPGTVPGSALTWPEYLQTYVVSSGVLLFNTLAVRWGYFLASKHLHITTVQTTALFSAACAAVTVCLYVYNVYIIDLLRNRKKSN